MNSIRKLTKSSFTVFLSLSCLLLVGCLDTKEGKNDDEKITIGVSAFDDEAYYVSDIVESVKQLAKENQNVNLVVKETSKDNLAEQQRNINELIAAGVDALIVNALEASDPNSNKLSDNAVNAAKAANIPIIFYGYRPDLKRLDNYDKAYFADSEHPARSAIVQAQMIMRHWKEKPNWDSNSDKVIQYALLKGSNGNFFAENRTYWLTSTFGANQGDQVIAEEVTSGRANWSPVMAEIVTEQWLQDPKLGEKIEVVIANNDSMALGALKAVQKLGLSIPVYGIDGDKEALNKIQQGELTGTVENSPYYLGKMTFEHMLNLLYKNRDVQDGDYVIRGSSLFSTQLYEPVDKSNVSKYLR